mgnify:CR=1 FL=1
MASRGINKVILVGRLGQDPESRALPSGGAVTNVSLATSETWNDKATGQPQERTEWHRVVFFNRLGEIAGEYLKKGSQVYIEGALRTRKWQDQNGNDRYSTEIVANEMQMLGGRPDGAAMGGQPVQQGVAAPQQSYQPQVQQAPQQQAPQQRAPQQAAPQAAPQAMTHQQAAPQQAYQQPQQGGFQPQHSAPQQNYQQAPQQAPQQAAPQPMGTDAFDDDIPF